MDLASDPSSTHAEAELAAFAASSKRSKINRVKLPLLGNAPAATQVQKRKSSNYMLSTAALGAESSWPHGVGTRPVSEPSTDALTSCNSLGWATNATAAAMLRTNTTYSRHSKMLPSISSSSDFSSTLGSHAQKGRHFVTPTSWQVAPSRLMWPTTESLSAPLLQPCCSSGSAPAYCLINAQRCLHQQIAY